MFENLNLQRFCDTQGEKRSIDPDAVKRAERDLLYKIPAAYLDLISVKDGDNIWRKFDHWFLRMTGFLSLNELVKQKEDFSEWGFPDIGIYFSWTESGGHEALLLNYHEIRKNNEPSVWLLDQELETGTLIADTFEEFIERIIKVQGYPDEDSDDSDDSGEAYATEEGNPEQKEFADWINK